MARCELTGKGPAVKNLVSHSNIKTKSRNKPNVQSKKMFSNALNRQVTLKLATSTIKALEAGGGFDKFILNAQEMGLSRRATNLRNQIRRKVHGGTKASKAAKTTVATKTEAVAVKTPAKTKKAKS
jgi:large subunit ribosomal protein L28